MLNFVWSRSLVLLNNSRIYSNNGIEYKTSFTLGYSCNEVTKLRSVSTNAPPILISLAGFTIYLQLPPSVDIGQSISITHLMIDGIGNNSESSKGITLLIKILTIQAA